MLYKLRAINRTQIKEIITDNYWSNRTREVIKTLGYTFLDQYDNSKFMTENQILKEMKNPNSIYKFTNLGYNLNYHLYENQASQIDVERHFHYRMIHLNKLTGKIIPKEEAAMLGKALVIKGWRLVALEKAVDSNFTNKAVYHGCPVICISKTFNGKVGSTLDLTKMDVSGIINCSELFSELSFINDINISTWEMPNLTYAERMFKNCLGIKTIRMGRLTIPPETNMRNMISHIEHIDNIEINEHTYNLFKQSGIRKHTTPENEENQRVKARILGIEEPIFANIRIM